MENKKGSEVKMAYYFFVTMNTTKGRTIISGMDIANRLIKEAFWVFSDTAPVVSRLNRDDSVLIYVGGKGRHWFVGKAKIAKSISNEVSTERQSILDELGIGYMRRLVELKECELFENPIQIVEIKEKLEFIVDKKNYGLSLRLPVRDISEKEYKLITAKK